MKKILGWSFVILIVIGWILKFITESVVPFFQTYYVEIILVIIAIVLFVIFLIIRSKRKAEQRRQEYLKLKAEEEQALQAMREQIRLYESEESIKNAHGDNIIKISTEIFDERDENCFEHEVELYKEDCKMMYSNLEKMVLQKGIELNANAHIVSDYSVEKEKVDTGEREVREVVSKNGRVSKQKFAVM